jgi:hypothetical protein
MIDKLRRDSLWMGMALGFLIPMIIFLLEKFILLFLPQEIIAANVFSLQRLILISIIPNVFLLRYYLLKLKYDLTGRGILAMTFVIGIIFIIVEFSS